MNGRLGVRLLALSVLGVTLAWIPTSPAGACSCAAVPADKAVRQGDGAFVGRAKESTVSGQTATWKFRVKLEVKHRFGRTILVEASAQGSACGLSARIGERIGLVLDRHHHRWESSLCSQYSAHALAKLIRTPSAPT